MHCTDAFVLIYMRILQTIVTFRNPLILVWLHRYNAVNERVEEWGKHMFYQSIQIEKFNLMFFIDHSNLYFGSNFFHLKTVVTLEKCNWIVCLHPKGNVRSAVKHLTMLPWRQHFVTFQICRIFNSTNSCFIEKSLLKTWFTTTSASFFCNTFIFINILTASM